MPKRRVDSTPALLREQESFSDSNPGWDHAYLVEEASKSVKSGMPLDRVRIIYGDDVAKQVKDALDSFGGVKETAGTEIKPSRPRLNALKRLARFIRKI